MYCLHMRSCKLGNYLEHVNALTDSTVTNHNGNMYDYVELLGLLLGWYHQDCIFCTFSMYRSDKNMYLYVT